MPVTIQHCISQHYEMEKDEISEVLSRLPAKSLLRCESVSKGCRDLISDNSFRNLQCHRVKATTSGFFFQDTCEVPYPVKYLSTDNDQAILQDTILDFLPEKVNELIASSNGLLCLTSCDDSKDRDKLIYVCNPAKKEYVQIEWPKGSDNHQDFALAFDPYHCLGDGLLDFKLVCICKEYLYTFSFQVYSSKTKQWRILDNCNCSIHYSLPNGQVIFASGVLYWMTYGDAILAFDVETEESYFIVLPVRRTRRREDLWEVCIGESKGRLHFILISEAGVQVWILDSEPKWVLKHSITLSAMEEECPRFLYNDAKKASRPVPDYVPLPPWIEPLVYKDEILIVKLRCSYSYENHDEISACTKIYLCNLDIGKMEELFTIVKLGSYLGYTRAVPYSMSLAPLGSA
ncbi:hypothetical protein IFM89_007008 [Coptis chinensis]|uniref:F-box domain-containing protein n=1 Tax=Coptis chinensis TaxID=261450 RepID=A0A835M4L1_9MAGN|nr:hypothetical protein IFM89_007008 [Coptis chinensis]